MTGDVLLCSGMISYMGIFNLSYRDYVIDSWKNLLKDKNIPHNINFSMTEILCDPNTLGIWVN